MERNVDYSLIFQVLLAVKQRWLDRGYKFYILMCTATLSDRVRATLMERDPTIITYFRRPYPLQRFHADVDTLPEVYEAIAACAAHWYRTEESVLAFLPGLSEIQMVQRLLTSNSVLAADIFELYAEMEYRLIRAAMTPTRIVLATSLAENAVTISDIGWVLDSGLCRHQNEDDGIPHTLDYKAHQSLAKQREGRAGRTKPGPSLRLHEWCAKS